MVHEFSSKRDRGLSVVVITAIVAVGAAGISSLFAARWISAGALFFAAAVILWVFYGTSYSVTESELIVRSGPLRWRVVLGSITSIEPSSDPTAAPASSLDRLEIRYDGGRRRILVSPADEQGFSAAVKRA